MLDFLLKIGGEFGLLFSAIIPKNPYVITMKKLKLRLKELMLWR
jgi:hypothetical protein